MAGEAKFWTAVVYPENMREDWEENVCALVEVPFAYCKHSLDHDQKSEHRKDHVHFFVYWPNNTTRKAVERLFNSRLSLPGKKCCPGVQPVYNNRRMYDYLIHDTEDCRQQGKELYPKEARIEGNNFDIGAIEQLSTEEKSEAAKEICRYIIERNICNLADVFVIVTESEDFCEIKYWEAFKQYNSMIDRICRNMYLKEKKAREEKENV